MKGRLLAMAAIVYPLLSGCATITSNEMQVISLNTKSSDEKPVEQAKCNLKNDKGTWDMVSPGFVSVHRSSEDLMVECKKEGSPDGNLRAISRAAGGMWGNILIGGGIGAIIDHNKGTGYNYPDELPVKMGESITVDRQKQNTPPSENNGTNVSQH